MVILILSTSGHKVKLGKTAFYLTADFWKRTCLMVSSDFSTSSCVTTLCVLEHHRSGLGEHWENVLSVTVFAKDLLVLQLLSGKEDGGNEK